MHYPVKIKLLKAGLIKDYGLLETEATALLDFKGHGSKNLNSKIRNRSLTNSDLSFYQNLKNGLLKLPSIKSNIIYRHLNFEEWQYNNAKSYFKRVHLGKIRFNEFLSCSWRSCFTGNPNDYNWTMQIMASHGSMAKDLRRIWRQYQLDDPEEEILFLSNACFEIIYQGCEFGMKVHLKEILVDLQIAAVPVF